MSNCEKLLEAFYSYLYYNAPVPKQPNPGKEKGEKMNDQTRDPTRIITLDDTQHVAFLKMRGLKVTPWIETQADGEIPQDPNSRRVEFQVEGDPDEISLEMQRFYADEPFPIQTFCRCLKEVKSSMYALRRIKKM